MNIFQKRNKVVPPLTAGGDHTTSMEVGLSGIAVTLTGALGTPTGTQEHTLNVTVCLTKIYIKSSLV